MKRILFLVIFLAILVSGYSQGNKFKAVNRTVPDSAVTGSFTKNAVLIDGSKSQKLHTGSLINSSLSSDRLPQLLDSISKDSLPKISVKPAC